MGLRKTPCFTVLRNDKTGAWEVVMVLAAKLRKADAQTLAKQMEANASAQEVLDKLNEGIDEIAYCITTIPRGGTWIDRKEGCCKTHGSQPFVVNANHDAFCPQCLIEKLQKAPEANKHVDKAPKKKEHTP